MGRRRLSQADVDAVLVASRRRCCLCFGLERDLHLKKGQIAHIDRDPSHSARDNLVWLCLDHHSEYDSRTSQHKGLQLGEVRWYRQELYKELAAQWGAPAPAVDRAAADWVLGRYVRESAVEQAEFEVTPGSGGLVRVSGVAVWGVHLELGPHVGELDLEARVVDDQLEYVDGDYRLAIVFSASGARATEVCPVGYFGMNVSFAGEYTRGLPRSEVGESFEKALALALPGIARAAGVRIEDVGLHLWLARPAGREQVLERVARARLSHATPSRPRRWRRGEGVVGRCWELQEDVGFDLRASVYRETSSSGWESLPPAVSLNMGFDEFFATTRHFAAIGACPVVVGVGSAEGCVSVNFDRDVPSAFAVLWGKKVRLLVRQVAAEVALMLAARSESR